MMMHLVGRYLGVLILLFMSTVAWCDSDADYDFDSDLAQAAANPLKANSRTKYYSFPWENDSNFEYHATHKTQDELSFKPVIPFSHSDSYDLILRTIAPFYHQPQNNQNNDYLNGIGDINPTLFISPTTNQYILWGIGPTLYMPTASNSSLGNSKWSSGPEVVILYMPTNWVLGILTNNAWSFAGDSDKPNFNQFTFEYEVTHTFPRGWYWTSNPTITANWRAAPGEQWTVPFGAGIGRAFHIGQQKLSLSIESYYNVEHPTTGSQWTIHASMNLMFPYQG